MSSISHDFKETDLHEWQWGKERASPPEVTTRKLPGWAKAGRLGFELVLLGATIWLNLIPVYVLLCYYVGALLLDYLPRIRYFGISRTLSRFNIRAPTRSDLLIAAGGSALIVATQLGLGRLLSIIGISSSSHIIATDSITAAVYVIYLLSFLVLVPAEEIMFRDRLQRYILGQHPRAIRVTLTSLLFGVLHLPMYGLSVSAAASIAVICIVSLIFGYCYELSRNLLVPITAHLFMNSIAISVLFFSGG